jgi:hypothetical protein
MKHSNEILAELQMVSPSLAAVPKVNPYMVPAGYFDHVTDTIMDEIVCNELLNSNLNITYSVPDQYFDGLAQNILAKIAVEAEDELALVAPVLHSVGKKNVYSVPTGFFTQEIAIPHQEEGQGGKLVTLKGYRRFIQYAAAAMVAGILVSGAFLYTDSKSFIEQEKNERFDIKAPVGSNDSLLYDAGVQDNDTAQAEEWEETTLEINKSSVDSQAHDFSKKISLLSEEELKKYLEENTVPEPMQNEPVQILDDSTGI